MPYAVRVTWAEGQYQASSPTTISANVGNAVAAGGGQASVTTQINCLAGNAVAQGSPFAVNEAIQLQAGNATAAGASATVTIYAARVTWAEAQYEAGPNTSLAMSVGNATAAGLTAAVSSVSGTTINAAIGNAVAGGPAGATVSEDITLVAATGNSVAAGSTVGITATTLISCVIGDAVAAGQQCQVLPPLTVAPSATPGYAPKTRYRVRVGSRWMEVDPLDPMSVRRAYDAAQEDAQDAATQDVEAPAAVAAQAVVVQPIKGPDYAGLAKEARRISEDIRKVYSDALQTALIARLMREQIERDDEDDIAVLLASI